jgi:prophage antirepressor-like protein
LTEGELISDHEDIQQPQHIIKIDGEPRFVAMDMWDALGYGNSRAAIERLDEEVTVSCVYTPGGGQEM